MVSINKDGLYRDYGIVQLELKRWTDGGAEMTEVFKGADATNYTSLYASQIQKNTQAKLTPEIYNKVVELAKQ